MSDTKLPDELEHELEKLAVKEPVLLRLLRTAAKMAMERVTGKNHPLANTYKCSGNRCQAAWIKRPIGREDINSNEACEHGWLLDTTNVVKWWCPNCKGEPEGQNDTKEGMQAEIDHYHYLYVESAADQVELAKKLDKAESELAALRSPGPGMMIEERIKTIRTFWSKNGWGGDLVEEIRRHLTEAVAQVIAATAERISARYSDSECAKALELLSQKDKEIDALKQHQAAATLRGPVGPVMHYAAIASELNDISSRIGVAASPQWAKGELEQLANKYTHWASVSPSTQPTAEPTTVASEEQLPEDLDPIEKVVGGAFGKSEGCRYFTRLQFTNYLKRAVFLSMSDQQQRHANDVQQLQDELLRTDKRHAAELAQVRAEAVRVQIESVLSQRKADSWGERFWAGRGSAAKEIEKFILEQANSSGSRTPAITPVHSHDCFWGIR